MGRRGPPPKPTILKKLAGNPGKRPLNENEPKPIAAGRISPPAWMDDLARKEWRRVVPELKRMGLLTKVDLAALEVYCDAVSTFIKAAEVVNAKGFIFKTSTGYMAQLPHVNIKNQAANVIRAFCQEFGLTPSSRSKIQLPNDDGEEEDPMEKLLASAAMKPDLRVIDGGKNQ